MDAPRKMSTATNEIQDECIHDVILVTQLPSQSWFEGFALRPNGDILATRLDEPELYTWDAEDADAQPTLMHTFEQSNGLINLSALPGRPDTFIVLSAVIDMGQVVFEDFIFWELSFSDDKDAAPKVTFLMRLEDIGMAIGLTALSDTILLVPDTTKACIWLVDLRTKSRKMLIEDETMSPAGEDEPFGINRMCIIDGHIWFTNSSKGILGRIPIEQEPADGEFSGRGVVLRSQRSGTSSGSYVQQVATDLVHCDGLSVLPDATAAYTASYNDGLLWKVEVDRETGQSEVTTVMSNLVNPTAVELIQVGGRLRLFIICNGEIEASWVTASDRMSWGDLKGLNETVEVSTSTVVTTTEVA